MNDSPVRRQGCTKSSRLVFSDERSSKDMRSTRAKRSGNFTGSGSRIEEVFENILGDVQIKALVTEGQVFKVFAANAIHDLPWGYARIVMACNVRRRIFG
jgi:hypothetical protein